MLIAQMSFVLIPALAVGGGDPPAPATPLGTHVLLGWNDLGMHCSNKWFRDLAVLPPYNTLYAQVLRRGSVTEPPVLLGSGYRLTYEFEDNTYSVGKTDFWSYEDLLFGVQLPDNVGLTGKGMTGTLDWTADHYEAPGTPLTPFIDSDLLHEQPYQIALLAAYDPQDVLLATTEIVAPVSNEMTCSNCHATPGETVELSILRRHDDEWYAARAGATGALRALPRQQRPRHARAPGTEKPVRIHARTPRQHHRRLLPVPSRTQHAVPARRHVAALWLDLSDLPRPHARRGAVDRPGQKALAG
jgi:hypothetical protein